MDSLSHLLAPRCEVNLHCRFGGRWQAGHQQMRSGVVPWHVVLRGEGRLNVGGQTHHLRAGDVVLLPHGSPHLMESLVEWGQVLPVAHRFNGTVTEMRAGPAEGALEMLCGEFYFGPHVSWLFSEASTLIHLHTDAREDCPELDALLNILVRESLAQRPGGSAIVRSLGDTLLVLLLRMLLGEQQPPGGLLRLMSDERLMPAVLAVMATPEQPWTLESMAARAFLSRATFARHFARVYHLTPQAWLSQLRMALAARLLRLERQTNLGRALLLLQKEKLITLKAGTGLLPTAVDITDNPHNLKIMELEGAQLPRVLDDPKVDVAIISTTYLQQTGLSPVRDGIFIEDKNSPYVNIIVTREDNKDAQNVKEFMQSYQSPEVAKAAETIFNGGAVPGW